LLTKKEKKDAYKDILAAHKKVCTPYANYEIDKFLDAVLLSEDPPSQVLRNYLIKLSKFKADFQEIKAEGEEIGLAPDLYTHTATSRPWRVDSATKFTQIANPDWRNADNILKQFQTGLVLVETKEELLDLLNTSLEELRKIKK
jgi:hypothetical protein